MKKGICFRNVLTLVIILNPLALLIFSLAISGKPCNDDIYGYLFREEQARLMLEYVYKENLNFVSSVLCILSADQFPALHCSYV
jgi:hypothetical protein